MNEHTHDLAGPLPDAAVAELTRIQRLALVVGGVGVLGCGIGAVVSPGQFLQAYLVAYIFVIWIVLG